MRRMLGALAIVPLMCLAIARPDAQTRESPLWARDRAKPAKWTRFVPPAVTAADIGGPAAVVVLELLVAPDGKVAEVTVRKAPPPIVEAVVAAAKQWEYAPMILDGKGAWFRVVSSITIRPMEGAATTAAPAPTSPAQVETVSVSTGLSRENGRRVTLVTRESQGRLLDAFLIAHLANARQTIAFSGSARVRDQPDTQLAVLPSAGRGWVFLSSNARAMVTDGATPLAEVRVARITRVPVGAARSHQELETTLMRAQ